nr:hypothetical protein [Tanacetum cinerariifolium]
MLISKDDADNNDDDSDESDGERTEFDRDEIPNPNKTNEQHDDEEEEYDDEFNIEEDEKMDKEEDNEVTKELYKDVNVNLGSKDADMTDADQDFASVFKFDKSVFNLEKDLSKMKKVDKYAKALSSIPAIVDRYIDNKLRDAINKAIQAHNFNCKEEAQAEKREYIELVDLTVRTIIKEEVNTQLP